jgi:peptidoglycan-associated lipoprotein
MKLTYRLPFIVLFASLALILGGCKNPTPATGEGANIDNQEADTEATDVAATDVAGGMGTTPEVRIPGIGNAQPGPWQPIYFDYDSAAIRAGDRGTIEEIAKWAKDNTDKKLVVAGHCDERGTLEYNRALGQRRASAAREYLVKLGVSAKQVATISYGEEQPADSGHSEDAWSKNRRDEFLILK